MRNPQPSTSTRGLVLSGSVADDQLLRAWTDALDRLELHLDELRGGLAAGWMPVPYEVTLPAGNLPAELAERARRVLVEQRDVEAQLRERIGQLSCVMAGASSSPAPEPVFLDRRD